MAFVTATTMTAGKQLITGRFSLMLKDEATRLQGVLNIAFTVFVIASVLTLLIMTLSRWLVSRTKLT
jgi:hypothetical protein